MSFSLNSNLLLNALIQLDKTLYALLRLQGLLDIYFWEIKIFKYSMPLKPMGTNLPVYHGLCRQSVLLSFEYLDYKIKHSVVIKDERF